MDRQPPTKAHYTTSASPDCRNPAYGDLSLPLSWATLLVTALLNSSLLQGAGALITPQPIPGLGLHFQTGPAAWARHRWLGPVRPAPLPWAASHALSSGSTGKHMENISTSKSQKHNVLQGRPPHPTSRGHRIFYIQKLQSRLGGRWLEMTQMQVPLIRWPRGHWRYEALPASPITTPKNAGKRQWRTLLWLLWRPRPSS